MDTGKELEVSEKPEQPFLSRGLALLDRYKLQSELVAVLGKTSKHSHLVPRVASCHRTYRSCHCDHGHSWAEPQQSCCVRLCPHCQRRRSTTLAHRVEKFLSGRPNLRYIVFSQKSTASLKEGQDLLWASWTRLRRSVFWQALVAGAIVALEVTFNAEENTWHPHLNVLFEGEFIPFEELNAEWVRATSGEGGGSRISFANAGTVRELIKYVTKLTDLLTDKEGNPLAEAPAIVEHFLTATAKRRFVRSYGTFYGIPTEEDDGAAQCCPDCDSTVVSKREALHPYQVFLDDEGILRPCFLDPERSLANILYPQVFSSAMVDRGG